MFSRLDRPSETAQVNRDCELSGVRLLRDCLAFDDMASSYEIHLDFNRGYKFQADRLNVGFLEKPLR